MLAREAAKRAAAGSMEPGWLDQVAHPASLRPWLVVPGEHVVVGLHLHRSRGPRGCRPSADLDQPLAARPLHGLAHRRCGRRHRPRSAPLSLGSRLRRIAAADDVAP